MTARDRYLRLFPKRLAELTGCLTPAQLVGYLKVLQRYVQSDDRLPDDDKLMCTLSGLPKQEWLHTKEVLLAHGYARVAAGLWIDDDQDESVERQRSTAERQRARALGRKATLVEVRSA